MGYIYQADVLCAECGEIVKAALREEGKAPADPSDETTYDSDDFPKFYDNEHAEADSPQHCANCEELLATGLTADGL